MYEVDPLDEIVGTVPDEFMSSFLEVRATLEVSPRSVGQPYLESNPGGMRTVTFGGGRAILVFGIIEHDRRVFLVSLLIV